MARGAIVRCVEMRVRFWQGYGNATIVTGHAGQSLDDRVAVLEI